MADSLRERFFSKVRLTDYCWFWKGATVKNGYGTLLHSKGRRTTAHRIAYELLRGPIPHGLFVLHKCDNRRCVNPTHLFLGTQFDNMRDMVAKGRNYQRTRPEAVARGDRNGSRTMPWRLRRGETQPAAKLTAEEVAEILRLSSEGVRQTDIAAFFGVSKSAINLIVAGKNWKHLTIGARQ